VISVLTGVTSTSAGEESLSDGGVPGRGPTQPIAHVSPFITALKWLYGKTILLSTDLVAELRELQRGAGWYDDRPGFSGSLQDTAELREVCYQ
jgi:hypothetical protein